MKSWFLLFCWVFAFCNPAWADERILEFFSDIKVERDGDLLVTENIRVRSEGKQLKHGVRRDFPDIYRHQDGRRHQASLTVVSVRRDGRAEPFAMSRLTDGVRLATGRPDVVFKPGEYQFEITYRISRQITPLAQSDTLRWNVTGNAWEFPIDRVRARVMLPDELAIAPLTGLAAKGEWGGNVELAEQEDGRIVLVSSRKLAPGQAATIALAWPQGAVASPGPAKAAWYWLLDNAAICIAVAGLSILFVYYLWVYLLTHKWRAKAAACLEPPAGMSALATRYVYRKVFDSRGFASGVMELLARRSIRIWHKEDGCYLERLPNHTGTDGRHDALLNSILTSFFGGQRELLRLDGFYRRCVEDAQQDVKQALDAGYGSTLFVNHRGLAKQGLYLWIVMVVALAGLFVVHAGGWRAPAVLGMLLPLPAVPLLYTAVAKWRGAASRPFGVAVLVVLALVLLGAGVWVLFISAETMPDLLAGLAPLATLPVVTGAFDFLHCYTAKGQEVRNEIDGFRRYLRRPKSFVQPLPIGEEAVEHYERYLPYALALNVQDEWAAAFRPGIQAGAGATALQEMSERYGGKYDVLTQSRRIMGGLK